jgi:hypothetical protein
VHDGGRIRLVYTFQDHKFHHLITDGSGSPIQNVVKDISKQENLQAVYLQPKGMAKYDK